MTGQRPPARHHFVALLLYTVLSLALTIPLAFQLASHVPGDGIDDPALAWNLWWIKYSLLDLQASPFPSSWLFFPIGINLAFYTLTILNGLLAIPLQLTLGLVPASNLVLLSSFILGGYGAYLLALAVLTGERTDGQRPSRARGGLDPHRCLVGAAFLAGLLYAFSSSKMFYVALGQFNIASSQWIPFAVLYVIRSGRPDARLREPLMAGLFLLLQAYAELIFASFLVIFIVLYGAYRGIRALVRPRVQPETQRQRSQLVPLLGRLALIGLVMLVGLVPILANMLTDMQAEGDLLVEGSGFADIFSADLAGYILPTQLHPLLGHVVRDLAADSQLRPDGSQWQVNKGQHLTLGFLGLALAVVGLWAGRKQPGTAFWALAAIVFFLLTLGPTVRVTGYETGIPGPFRLLQALPFFQGNRYPSRYSVMLLASVVPLVALGSYHVLNKLASLPVTGGEGQRARHLTTLGTVLLATVIILENLSAPLPTSDMRVPTIYETVTADPDQFALLDLPLGWRNGFSVFGKQDVIIMFEQWWQTRHAKPILGGNTSRNPEHKFRYFLEAPLIGPLTVLANADEAHPHIREQMANGLAALRAGDPELGGNELLQRAAQEGTGVLQQLDTRYVVVHKDHVPPEFVTFIERYLPLQPVVQQGQHVLYQADLPEPKAKLELHPARDSLSRGSGWSGRAHLQLASQEDNGQWAQRQQTELIIPPLLPGPKHLIVHLASPGPDQTLALSFNGYRTAPQQLREGPNELSFPIPAHAIGSSVNRVELLFGTTYPVEDVLAQGPTPASLLVESAGLEAGDYGHIWLNGRDISPNQRGYNLAIIDPVTWQPTAVASFDTHGDPTASDYLVTFLEQLGEDDILALAVKDTAAAQLSPQAAEALVNLGLSDLRGRFRWSQAALVLPPQATGEQRAVGDQINGLEGTSVGWGPAWREPRVAALVERIIIEPSQ